VASGRAAPSRHAATPAADPGRGGNLLHSLVLVLLTGAASGLGYWGYGLQQDLEVSVAQQAGLAQRLAELEQLLEVTSDSASQSGQTLSGRLAQQGKIATEKYSHFDSEIAKLWTIAYQSNKPRLDAQEKQLALQAEQLKAQVGQLDAQAGQWAQLSDLIKQQGGQLAAQGGEIKSLQTTLAASGKALADVDKRLAAVSGLEKGQASLKGDLDKTVLEMKRSVATLDTQVRIAEEVQSEKVATLQGAQRTLGDKIAALEAGAGSTDVTRRVRSNEQAIQAIDGSRRQLNRELLQIRQQLNELQLRLR
jgi:chromosome segregation ATPase